MPKELKKKNNLWKIVVTSKIPETVNGSIQEKKQQKLLTTMKAKECCTTDTDDHISIKNYLINKGSYSDNNNINNNNSNITNVSSNNYEMNINNIGCKINDDKSDNNNNLNIQNNISNNIDNNYDSSIKDNNMITKVKNRKSKKVAVLLTLILKARKSISLITLAEKISVTIT